MQSKIYVCYHKKSETFLSDVLVPVQSGRAISSVSLDMIGDNTGDNISFKNPYYNELAVLYWMWKNSSVDNVGLFYYRRYFDLSNKNKSKEILLHKFPKNFLKKYSIQKETVEDLLKDYDLILPCKSGLKLSIYEHYKRSHIISDFDLAISIIKKKYPEMNDAITTVINGHYIHPYNMFIAKKKIIDGYCEWLFDILSEVENKIQNDVNKRDSVSKRVYGYLGERLFNIYVEYLSKNSKIKIKYVPVIWINSTKQYFKLKIKQIKRKILTILGYRKEYW